MLAQQVQTAIHALFPPNCLGCRDLVTTDYALCARCWRDLPLIVGPICQRCGTPVLAEDDDTEAICQDCADTPRPWSKGRSALRYAGLSRKLIRGLKQYDRYDVAPGAGQWMSRIAPPLLHADTIIAPVPLHWMQMIKRRYNQAALLAQAVGQRLLRPTVLDLLHCAHRLDRIPRGDYETRVDAMRQSIIVNPKRLDRVAGARVLLVDDMMDTGATLTACAEACLAAGARDVNVLTLARLAKDT